MQAIKINLFIVASPIGNINEVTFHNLETLENSDVIVCESIERTKKIFYKYKISMPKKFLKCNKSTEELAFFALRRYLEKLSSLKTVQISLISNAGYPLIADPGWYFVKQLKTTYDVQTFVSNGACSINHALMVSGFKINSFFFFGFLPKKTLEFQKKIQKVKELATLIVFFLSKHRLKKELKQLSTFFPKNEASLAVELSKVNERVINGNLEEIMLKTSDNLKGEIVLTIKNY